METQVLSIIAIIISFIALIFSLISFFNQKKLYFENTIFESKDSISNFIAQTILLLGSNYTLTENEIESIEYKLCQGFEKLYFYAQLHNFPYLLIFAEANPAGPKNKNQSFAHVFLKLKKNTNNMFYTIPQTLIQML